MPTMLDEQLIVDLDLIDSEIKRRKNSRPFEPFAVWAMNSRIDALAKFNARQLAVNHRRDSDASLKKKPTEAG